MTSAPHAVRISFRREDFRFDFSRPFWPVAGGALLVAETLSLLPGSPSVSYLVFTIPSLVLGMCAATLWAMSGWYRLEISPSGIHWYGLSHQPRQTPWSSIEQAALINVLGLEYLRIRTRSSTMAVWIPLFVTRYSRLRDLLVTYADSSQHLNDRLDEDY